jgi:hypothetical protein
MGWMVWGLNPSETRFSARPDWPWGPPSLLYNGYWVFPGVKYGQGVLLTTHPLLVPWSWKSRAVLLPTLWATTGPVTEHFTVFIYNFSTQYSSTWMSEWSEKVYTAVTPVFLTPPLILEWCTCKTNNAMRYFDQFLYFYLGWSYNTSRTTNWISSLQTGFLLFFRLGPEHMPQMHRSL